MFLAGTEPGQAPKLNGGIKDATFDYIVITGRSETKPGDPVPVANADIYAQDITTGDTLLHGVSNAAGDYTLVFAWTGQKEQTAVPDESGKVLENPAINKASIQFSSPGTETYKLHPTDVSGRTISDQDIELQKGIGNIEITGLLPQQCNLITLASNDKVTTFRIENYGTERTTPSVNVTHVSDEPTVTCKSTPSPDLKLMFRHAGLYDKDTLVNNTSATVNVTMEKIPTYIINTSFKPYDINGNPANITITAHWPNENGPDSIINYSANANDEIIISKKQYVATATAVLELDSVAFPNNLKYLAWLVGRKIHQPREENNLFTSSKEWGQQFTQAVTIDRSNPNISDHVIYNYVVPKMVKNPNNGAGWGQVSGDSIRMDHPVVNQQINRCDGFAVGTEKYIRIPGVPEKNPFYVLTATHDMDLSLTGFPQMPQWQMDRLKAQQPKVEAIGIIPGILRHCVYRQSRSRHGKQI